MKRILVLELLVASVFVSPTWLAVAPVQAQIIELGDDVRVDLSNDRDRHRRTNVRVYGDDGRLNLGLEEERRPQTRVRLSERNGSPTIDVRQERPEPEERVRLSLPF